MKRTVCPSCGFSDSVIVHEKHANTPAGYIQASRGRPASTQEEILNAIAKGIPILCSNQVDANSVRSSAVYLDAKLKVRQRKGKEGIYVTIKKP